MPEALIKCAIVALILAFPNHIVLDTDWNITIIAATDRSLNIWSQLLNIKLRDNARFAPMIYAPASHTFDGTLYA